MQLEYFGLLHSLVSKMSWSIIYVQYFGFGVHIETPKHKKQYDP